MTSLPSCPAGTFEPPMMSSAPAPVVIVSLPWPPTTMLRPLPASIVSSEPMTGSTSVKVEVYVHGTGAYGTVGTVGR